MATRKLTYLAGGEDGSIRVKTAVRAVGGLEVVVRITHCGVCGTDGHDRTAGCGLGHEGIGIVEEIGKEVTAIKVGQRVGCSWQTSSCGHCRECFTGYRQYCPESLGQKYGDLEQGAFGDYVVRHQDFVYPIPDEIESKYAGPLICAGITVFEALMVAETKSTDRVGIVGLGGLGHLAVMYARAMGCDVVVLSSREDKRADAMKLGATEFSVLRPQEQSSTESSANINVLLLCGGSMSDLSCLIPLLARRARIIPLVIQGEPLVIPYMPFLLPGHRIIASTAATKENHAGALLFAARHNIKPWIEEFPMSVEGLTKALEKLQNGSIFYRAVLSTEVGTELK
ncbi:NADP-dependent alcohol dehydrogenase [Pleurostoma richardsiae]|uniref:NADP-dependent alcohol dehydrogenase n=1 Tax=Pleurostoma richardsiae TaxID=41990 RepID=A0AA38RPM1_9PEZI|nr:NADP-dependent alcohol dehydrogenase [Pleurostoma richardsiae]